MSKPVLILLNMLGSQLFCNLSSTKLSMRLNDKYELKKSIKVKLCTIFFSGQAKQNWSVDISHWKETSYKNHDEI